MHAPVCLSVHHVFYINLYVLVICNDIPTKFAGNVYCYENMSGKMHGLILNNKMAIIADCLKNSVMCSKSLNTEASFINFKQNVYGRESLPQGDDDLILKTKWLLHHMFMVKWWS